MAEHKEEASVASAEEVAESSAESAEEKDTARAAPSEEKDEEFEESLRNLLRVFPQFHAQSTDWRKDKLNDAQQVRKDGSKPAKRRVWYGMRSHD